MDIIAVIASPAAVVAIVNVLKEFGVAGKWATLAAVLIGVALAVANHYLGGFGVYQAAMTGLVMGLAAAGVYDLAKPQG